MILPLNESQLAELPPQEGIKIVKFICCDEVINICTGCLYSEKDITNIPIYYGVSMEWFRKVLIQLRANNPNEKITFSLYPGDRHEKSIMVV